MDFNHSDLIIVGPVAILISALQLSLGALAGWVAHARQAPPPSDPLSPENVHELVDQLQFMAGSTSDNIVQHSARLQEVNSRLSSALESEESQQAVIAEATAQLLQANEQLQAALDSAQEQLEVYTQQIELNMIEARTDGLTRVANRRAFDEELSRRYAAWERRGWPCSLLMIDVDHFKKFNDLHGHQAGDEVLKTVGGTLSQTAREMDFVARYGGEEFAIILPDTPLNDGKSAAERIRAAIAAAKVSFHGQELRITASVGLAELMARDTPASFIDHADRALYAAKENGRNRSYFFDGANSRPIDASVVQRRNPVASAVQREIMEHSLPARTADRRKHQRRPFCYTQVVAPYRWGRFPAPDMFREVQCQDLAAGGCSFLLPDAPDCDAYIVALGIEPNCTYVVAEVLHARRDFSKSPPVFVVGCRFTGRIEREALPSVSNAPVEAPV
ncbi:MAG: diguanylate cyclase [Planctomycetes bacterium]|nr:diguanylate cyclase [Planctomycetota bacterium]